MTDTEMTEDQIADTLSKTHGSFRQYLFEKLINKVRLRNGLSPLDEVPILPYGSLDLPLESNLIKL